MFFVSSNWCRTKRERSGRHEKGSGRRGKGRKGVILVPFCSRFLFLFQVFFTYFEPENHPFSPFSSPKCWEKGAQAYPLFGEFAKLYLISHDQKPGRTLPPGECGVGPCGQSFIGWFPQNNVHTFTSCGYAADGPSLYWKTWFTYFMYLNPEFSHKWIRYRAGRWCAIRLARIFRVPIGGLVWRWRREVGVSPPSRG